MDGATVRALHRVRRGCLGRQCDNAIMGGCTNRTSKMPVRTCRPDVKGGVQAVPPRSHGSRDQWRDADQSGAGPARG
jgi:hypothetical protein